VTLTKDLLGGDLAGSPDVYARSGCPSTCIGVWSFSRGYTHFFTFPAEFVNDNPSAFSEAYWEIASLNIYQ
jgi:hypothetical protein